MTTYTTKQGDMWDAIAYQVYGSTAHTPKLIKANPEHSRVYIFDAGVELNVPDLVNTDMVATYTPPWRR